MHICRALSDELPPEHPRDLVATTVVECGPRYDRADAPISLELPDGTRLVIDEGRLVPESRCPYAPRAEVDGGCAVGHARARAWWLFGLVWLFRRRR